NAAAASGVRLLLPVVVWVMLFDALAVMAYGASPSSSPAFVVSGRIISSVDNQPIPGVNINIKGTNTGTVSDADGRYTIDVPSRESVLVFTAIGYETQEVVVGERSVIDIALAESITSLGEIIVTGYGTQEKVSMTSAVGVVQSEELVRRPVTTLQPAMQGTVAGLTILDNGGSPATPNHQILLRGVNTLYSPPGQAPTGTSDSGNNQPLVIVDGIEQPFQNINPEDIESVSVL